jgi:hypothetical protein
VSDTEILVEAPRPRGAATWRAAGATWDGHVLTVKVKAGADVVVPPDARVIVNGVGGSPDPSYPAARVPEWFGEVAAHRAKIEAGNEKLVAEGRRALAVPPVHFTLADTDEGPVARFDQR